MEENEFCIESSKLKEIIHKLDKEDEELIERQKNSTKNYDKSDFVRAHLLYLIEKRLQDIKLIKKKPYFARLDFRESTSQTTENLYIGKLSILDYDTKKPLIVDWRAPIANLYYEGRIGKASYNCLEGEISGEISLKRQFFIEDGILQKYADIDVTTNDSLLQEALSQNADDRLKNIVATIQEEQNKIIRADMGTPLIVQGVAGSGKTTIALHRIAYLVYQYDEKFKPEEFMIIAPNKFFLNYISNMYIHYKIYGAKYKNNLRHIIIDEAQDYGEFQFWVLKTILNSNSLTILGDIAQGVHYFAITRAMSNINVYYQGEMSKLLE